MFSLGDLVMLLKWKFMFKGSNQIFYFSKILQLGFDESFIRTWEYYFDYCAAGFKSRTLNNYQVCISMIKSCMLIIYVQNIHIFTLGLIG